MKNVTLEGSQLAGVNLRVATLKNANLQNCDLRGAVLAGADLEVCTWMYYPISVQGLDCIQLGIMVNMKDDCKFGEAKVLGIHR